MGEIVDLDNYRRQCASEPTRDQASPQSDPEIASVVRLDRTKTDRPKSPQAVINEQFQHAEQSSCDGLQRAIFNSDRLYEERFGLHKALFEHPMPRDRAITSSVASRTEGQKKYFDTYANVFRVSDDEPISKLGILQLSHVRAFCESSILRWIYNLREEGLVSTRLLDGVDEDVTTQDYRQWKRSIAPDADELQQAVGIDPTVGTHRLMVKARSIDISDYFEKVQPKRYAARVALDAVVDMATRGEFFARDLCFDGEPEELANTMIVNERRAALHTITSERTPLSKPRLLCELGRLTMYQRDIDIVTTEQAFFANPRHSNVQSIRQ